MPNLIHRPITFRSELMWGTSATELEDSHLSSAPVLARGLSESLDMSWRDYEKFTVEGQEMWRGRSIGHLSVALV